MTRTMPADLAISVAAKPGTDVILSADQGERKHPMRGYDDTYVDIVDFIVRVTHRIWEEKDIGHIYDTYRHNCRVTDDYGLQYGRDKIVADTVHTINAFPDVRLYADEVIWAGDEDRGFETSHRTVILGHNTGYSKYGPPTRRKVVVWAIANCSSRENEFYEEWVLYNNSSLLNQLGFDLRRLARDIGNATHLDSLGEQQGEVAQLLPRAVVLARLVKVACLQSACDFLGKADANEAAGGHRIARPDEAYSLRGADDLAQAGRSQGTGGPILYIQDRRSVKMLESANGKHVNEIGSGATDVCRHHTADSTLVEGVMCRRDTVEPKGKEAIRWRRLRPEPLPARRGPGTCASWPTPPSPATCARRPTSRAGGGSSPAARHIAISIT